MGIFREGCRSEVSESPASNLSLSSDGREPLSLLSSRGLYDIGPMVTEKMGWDDCRCVLGKE